MAQNQKGKQSLKAQRRYNAHIDRGNGLSVIAKKCLPALRRRLIASGHIFRDRRLGDLIAKLQELAMDPRCTPQRVFHAYAPDQFAKLAIDPRPPRPIPGFPPPEGLTPARCQRKIVSG